MKTISRLFHYVLGDTLGAYPAPTMRVSCQRCDRKSEYQVDQLIREHGAEAVVTKVPLPLTKGCAGPCDIIHLELVERGII